MNLGHVLSRGSSISSLASLECNSRGRGRGRGRSSSAVSVTVVCRSSNSDSRRSNGDSSGSSSRSSGGGSGSGRGSNALSSRPRGPREQSNGNQNGNANSGGSRERYGRYSGGSDGDGKNSSRNSRGLEGRYGGGRGSGGGGGGGGGGGNRGRGDRRDREGKMHPGAYKMRDEQTGDLVIVWGVEDDDDIPMPTAADLNWKETTVALPGDISDEAWTRLLEQQIGSSGVELQGKDWTDNLFEEDSENDFDGEDDFSDDEDDYSDSESEELTESSQKVTISRAPVSRNATHDDDRDLERSAAAKSDDKFAERSRSSKSDSNPSETSRAAKTEEKSWERSRTLKVSNESAEGRVAKINDRAPEGRSKGSKPVVEGRNTALETDDEVTEGRDNKTSSGTFNPYILDISEEDGHHSQSRQQNDVRKSGLLDRLRSQVLGSKPQAKDGAQNRNPHDTEDLSSPTAASRSEDRESVRTPMDDPIRPAMRDLTARDNYDASIANDFFSLKSFKDVGATPEVIQALSYLHVEKPSQIQAMAFKPILEGQSCIIAEQTGSGKTLAYVAPLVQRLRADEARTLGKSLSKKPRVLVLVPTGELAAQVLSNFRALSKGGVPCRSIVITGGFKWKTQVESLEGGADVVVATPGRLLQLLEAGNIHFDNLKSVVLDEVDILFDDEDFSQALQTINKAASIKVQYVHVTATLPVDIHDDLLERYPDCLSLMGPSLHRTAIGLQEVLVDCSGGEQDDKTPESAFVNKRKALLQLVEERPVAKTIIFCNKMETCRKVENVLSRYDRSGKKITVLPYHAALSQETRLESMESFVKSPPKERLFLVCTDRASRGIDSLDVEHVVLFDFPRDPSEYVRRVGRTARGAGGTGTVFAFVVGRQVGHARRIMARNDKGEPVHDVPGSRYYYKN